MTGYPAIYGQQARRIMPARRAVRSKLLNTSSALVYIGAHGPLAIAMWRVPPLATLHAVVAVCAGALFATNRRRPELVVGIIAYIAGAEVAWRMSKAPYIFWETGKYSMVLIAMLSSFTALRHRPGAFRWLYAGAFLPSAPQTLFGLAFSSARKRLSFNLSGPLALAFCAGLLSRIRLSSAQMTQVLVTALGPLFGVLSITMFSTSTAKNLEFGGESNFQTSGGFGPNQVSTTLGFGALAAALLIVLYGRHLPRALKHFLLVLALAFAAQSALTFSRTGLYLTVLSLGAAATVALRDVRLRATIVVVGLLGYVAATWFIAPRLNEFTHGALGKRFDSIDSSRRDTLARADLEVWKDHLLMGVGPGMAAAYRPDGLIAHTEFTRVLAEHGLFGLAALLLLAFESWRSFRIARSVKSKALVAAMLTYGTLFMLTTAMRLSLPAFAIGLTFAKLEDE